MVAGLANYRALSPFWTGIVSHCRADGAYCF
jgi:hypothetical protein